MQAAKRLPDNYYGIPFAEVENRISHAVLVISSATEIAPEKVRERLLEYCRTAPLATIEIINWLSSCGYHPAAITAVMGGRWLRDVHIAAFWASRLEGPKLT